MSLTARLLIGLVAGLVVGVIVAAAGNSGLLRAVAVVEPLGTLWVNAIRMTVVPLVVALLITGITQGSPRRAGQVGGRALVLFVIYAAGAGLIAAVAAPPLLGLVTFDTSALASLGDTGSGSVALPPLRDWVVGLIPTNPVEAAADGTMLPLIVFSTILAIAITRLDDPARKTLVGFFAAVSEAMFVIVGWILAVAPFGVFFLVLGLTAETGAGLVGALGYFVLVACVLVTVALAAVYPVTAAVAGISMPRFARACAAAQAVAFSTRSSLATLPAMLEAAEHELGLPPRVSGMTLPIAAAVFKFSSPTARMTGAVFVAQLYGLDLGFGAMAALLGAIVALSFYSPGIPSGGLFVLTPIFMAFGLPVEGVGLLIALDLIPDMFITTANVTADLSVTAILAGGNAGGSDPPAPEERPPGHP